MRGRIVAGVTLRLYAKVGRQAVGRRLRPVDIAD